MTLIKSISGIRGTIGGRPEENLTPLDLVAFLSAYAQQLKQKFPKFGDLSVVLGRDGRISGPLLHQLASSVLRFNGISVLDVGLATTPTVEMAVIREKAQGGIILSASHNLRQWNALKLLNEKGEFLNAEDGEAILTLAKNSAFIYADIDSLGREIKVNDALESHIAAITALKLVRTQDIAKRNFKIVVDGINSVGALAIPTLLESLGVKDIEIINGDINGEFAHNPEPLDQFLEEIKQRVVNVGADLGIVVDPDVDRLAFIDEKGKMFGEEYTLVAVADYVMHDYCPCFYQKISVSNLSSSRALKDITEKRGGAYYAAAVGEVNVVNKMKETGAVIGGEGNGGVIYPELHYGRDALVGTALFLSFLAQEGVSVSELKRRYPQYQMIKDRIDLNPETDVKALLIKIKEHYQGEQINDMDGLKIDWPDSWVHLRASNTEPIIRIYAEANTYEEASRRVQKIKEIIA
ncbi:MAG TPA: phosphoglucosamine mutase [bacterium]|nr:phosphoglucosamine mutase [bacterium]HQQ38083.1 phosphoglucosamine mutase [bacterium]